MRSRSYKTEAIVIKRTDFAEADKIITVFSKHYGKIRFLAKGIRKISSRRAAALEPFNQVILFLAKGRNLDIVTEAKILNSFAQLRNNLKKVGLAFHFCELVDRLCAEEEPNPKVFALLKQSLAKLMIAEQNLADREIEYGINLLKLSGFGLPKKLGKVDLDNYFEEITEKKMSSKNLLKKIE